MRFSVIPLVGLFLTLQTGCGIPDLKPFADATAEMSTNIKAGFAKTQATMDSAAETETGDDKTRKAFQDQSKELAKAWKPTTHAISALVEYSDSLSAIAAAGKKGQASVAGLADSVEELSKAIPLPPLAGPAFDQAKAIITLVGGKIIEMRAEHDIRKAIAAAIESVEMLAPLLKENLASLKLIHDRTSIAWELHVKTQYAVFDTYNKALVSQVRDGEQRATLIHDYDASCDKGMCDKENLQTFRCDTGACGKDNLKIATLDKVPDAALPAAVTLFRNQVANQLKTVRAEIAAAEPENTRMTSDLRSVQDARQLGDSVLTKGAEAIDAWQEAHKSLRATAAGRQTRVSVSNLVSVNHELAANTK